MSFNRRQRSLIKQIFKRSSGIVKTIKRRGPAFLLVGICNFIATSSLLLISLKFTSPFAATLIAQVFNSSLGYWAYKKHVFALSSYKKGTALRYIFLSVTAWIINWQGINILHLSLGISRSLCACIMIIILTVYSFILQSELVYRKG
jgi:putative flippase GtrA